jgi:hypothetical protein
MKNIVCFLIWFNFFFILQASPGALTNVTHCYFCRGKCDKPVKAKCDDPGVTTPHLWEAYLGTPVYACWNLRIIHTNKIFMAVLNLTDASWDEHGFYKEKSCVPFHKFAVGVCRGADQMNGNSCIMCIQELCNWKSNGHAGIYTPIFFITFLNLISFCNVL